jgi:hypothetical protein
MAARGGYRLAKLWWAAKISKLEEEREMAAAAWRNSGVAKYPYSAASCRGRRHQQAGGDEMKIDGIESGAAKAANTG